MHLMVYMNEKGERVYTLAVRFHGFDVIMFQRFFANLTLIQQKKDPQGRPTESAHPARFSPDDQYSKYRVLIKRRYGLLAPQKAT